jgi:uncharacterized protein (DUF924 family)
MTTTEIDGVIEYWLGPWMTPGPSPADRMALWFKVTEATDAEIRRRFLALIDRATRGELGAWIGSARGALALVILLDQFTRNAFRGTARAFEHDSLARAATKQALASGVDRELPTAGQLFLYMPLVHSEDLADHFVADENLRRAVDGADAVTREIARSFFNAALKHAAIIERFGRYPHRNAVLGRASTPEEVAFLGEPGSSF